MRFVCAKNYEDMSRKAANILSAQIIVKPSSILGLATGSTPIGIYQQLIKWYEKGDLDFSECTSINLDEYCDISPDNEQSYHYFMHHRFFDRINIPESNIHIPNGDAVSAATECRRYDDLITKSGGIDVQLLGIGRNAHIGFNEPSDSFSRWTHKVALSQSTIEPNRRFFERKEDVPQYAISVGMQAIMQAKKILLVASGKEKAEAIRQSFFGSVTPRVPASILQLHQDVTVIADTDALSLCNSEELEVSCRCVERF